MIIAIDFDGTCVTHDYPNVGKDIGAVPVLKWLVNEGHQLILWTMRSKGQLHDAVGWFAKNEIPLYGCNKNPNQSWSDSPKAYAELYIDDAALGCPLMLEPNISPRPFVDWKRVEYRLKQIFAGQLKIGHTALVLGGTNESDHDADNDHCARGGDSPTICTCHSTNGESHIKPKCCQQAE